MLNDPLAATLSVIFNAEKIGKETCRVKPISKIIKKVLEIMQREGYIGEVKEIEDGKGNFFEINLLGKINKCGAIKPRFSIKKGEYNKCEKRYLPAKDFGIIIISTSKGIVTLQEAIKSGLGGKLLAYCY